MIKAVLFDYGGVLSEGGKIGGIQAALGRVYGVDPTSITMDDLHYQYIRGQITATQFFDALNNRYPSGAKATEALFEAQNKGFFTRCELVYDLAARLRAAGIKTGIISNVYAGSAAKLRSRGFYNDFDPVVLSCEEHMAKPERTFFEIALNRLGLPGSEVLFIDDQERFRLVAESFGMCFILATSPQQIVDDVISLVARENAISLDKRQP